MKAGAIAATNRHETSQLKQIKLDNKPNGRAKARPFALIGSLLSFAPARDASRANSVPLESQFALIVLEWSHFLRRTGFHFAGKCSHEAQRV
jgi:hypothetical protein